LDCHGHPGAVGGRAGGIVDAGAVQAAMGRVTACGWKTLGKREGGVIVQVAGGGHVVDVKGVTRIAGLEVQNDPAAQEKSETKKSSCSTYSQRI